MPITCFLRRFRAASALAVLALPLFGPASANAAGTLAGTDISNTAVVTFDVAGTTLTRDSNTVTLTVAETLDVAVVVQSTQQSVDSGAVGQELLFTVTNTGNGSESFLLNFDNDFVADPGVDFNPVGQTPAIYFDTDGSGDFSAGDVAYNAGVNDPVLAADASVGILIVNDIPAGLVNGNIGRSALLATANTGSGAGGTAFAGQGTGGVDAGVGASGGTQTATGEYIVSEVTLNANKSASIADPFGGSQPVPGATITYTIAIDVASAGTAVGAVVRDAIPANTTYVANSLSLNGAALSDAADGDAGELDTATVPTVVVRLGDVTQASGTQTIQFDVVIL
ncbi:MAG: hypothetical protein AAFZ58_08260 [Pseudomonadota bacterium]